MNMHYPSHKYSWDWDKCSPRPGSNEAWDWHETQHWKGYWKIRFDRRWSSGASRRRWGQSALVSFSSKSWGMSTHHRSLTLGCGNCSGSCRYSARWPGSSHSSTRRSRWASNDKVEKHKIRLENLEKEFIGWPETCYGFLDWV